MDLLIIQTFSRLFKNHYSLKLSFVFQQCLKKYTKCCEKIKKFVYTNNTNILVFYLFKNTLRSNFWSLIICLRTWIVLYSLFLFFVYQTLTKNKKNYCMVCLFLVCNVLNIIIFYFIALFFSDYYFFKWTYFSFFFE